MGTEGMGTEGMGTEGLFLQDRLQGFWNEEFKGKMKVYGERDEKFPVQESRPLPLWL